MLLYTLSLSLSLSLFRSFFSHLTTLTLILLSTFPIFFLPFSVQDNGMLSKNREDWTTRKVSVWNVSTSVSRKSFNRFVYNVFKNAQWFLSDEKKKLAAIFQHQIESYYFFKLLENIFGFFYFFFLNLCCYIVYHNSRIFNFWNKDF